VGKAMPDVPPTLQSALQPILHTITELTRTIGAYDEQVAQIIERAYPIAKHDQAFVEFINLWIDLKKKDGTIDTLYRYWVLGRNDTLKTKRWSIVRDVLHWVD